MKKLLLALICGFALLLGCLWLSVPGGDLLGRVPFGNMALDARGDVMRISLAADGRYRLRVKLDQIAPEAVEATLKYEDQYFYLHPGVNPFSILRAVASLAGSRPVGASTLTMQVARLLYGLKTGDVLDKLKQIWLALAIELHHGKEEILEAYFNLAPYGGNIEGIEAASRVYFHKPAGNITPLESLALAIVPQNPVHRLPGTGRDFGKAFAKLGSSLNADQIGDLKIYTQKELPFRARHLSLQLLAETQAGPIKTGIEPDLQAALERSLRQYAKREQIYGLNNAAAIIVRTSDMQVVALAGSADYDSAAISGQIDGTSIRRSPGSTLKPFIYALALDQGLIHPGSILPDSPRSFGGYDPGNFDREFRGPVPAQEALKTSRNLPAIVLAEQLKNPDLYEFLNHAEVKFAESMEYYGLALVLGGAEVSMRELAALYAMLANKGIWQPLRYATGLQGSPGKRLLSPEAAWITLQMLARPEASVRGRNGDVPVYYKTGTSNGMRDAWTAGILGQYALVVWVGNFDNSANPRLVGASAALPLFEEISRSVASLARLEERLPPANTLKIVNTRICAATGDLYKGQCATTDNVWFIPGVSPTRASGILRPVWINEATGLRACNAGAPGTREIWWEFWPSEMRRIFERAGIHKPAPPEWEPQCRKPGEEAVAAEAGAARGPRIILPKKNVTYHRQESEANFRLPLQASTDPDSDRVYWYADGKYLGSSRGDEIIFWNAKPGTTHLLAVDSNGKSARQLCRVGVTH